MNRVICVGGSKSIALLWRAGVVERATEHLFTRFATPVDEWRDARLSDYSRSVTSARGTHVCRRRWNGGRLFRSFFTRAEDVFTPIAAMVNKWRRTEPSRSVTAAFRADVWYWRFLHEGCSSK